MSILKRFKSLKSAYNLITCLSVSMPITKQILNKLIYPIVLTIILNLMFTFLFISNDQQLFSDFRDFGLKGSWNFFTLNLQGTLSDGTIKTFYFMNNTLDVFLIVVIGNIFLSSFNMVKIYRDKKNLSIPPTQER